MSERFARAAGVALFLIAGLAGAATPLLVPLPAAKADAKSTDRPVRFNAEALEPLAPGAEVELTLPNGSRHDYIFESSVSHGGGFRTWIARSPLSGDNERAVITYGPHGAWGWMRTTYGDYRIYPSGLGYDLIAKREPKSYAPKFGGGDAIEVGPDDPRIAPLTGVPTILEARPGASVLAKGLKVTPFPVAQADIMFLYTKDLAQKLGVGLLPMIYNTVASLNLSYSDSEVAISLRLVNATMIDYANGEAPSANGSPGTLEAMGGTGANAAFFEPLTWGAGSLRNTVAADFVALLRDGPQDTGGIASLLKNPVIYPTSTVTFSTAYSVNNSCAQGCEGLVAHEIGHNMGNHHDPATIAKDSGNGTVTSTGVFSYSYGYYSCANGLTCNPYIAGGCASGYASCAGPTNANDFGTIMSYFGPKPMKFSNPLLSNCVPPGGNAGAPRTCGGSLPAPAPATTSNNALSMNNVRGALSAYRNQTITNLPGSLQFTNTVYTGGEGSNLTFTVSRASGSSGAVSVTYTVTAGSATAGTDFVAGSGTLNWADGDATNKTFNVALTADALVEGVETINATLASPTGALGVYLGYPTIATGLIIEPSWPPGTLGGLPTEPAGWSTPAGATASSVPWSIVNDSAPLGDSAGLSLKSGLLDFGGPANCSSAYGVIPCPSSVEITRDFSAGTIAYAYRVSAFPNNGFLELLVDNVVVHSATGVSTNTAADTGWQFFSTTLSAGTHTLRWRYRPVFYFGCQYANSGGAPLYPNCLDRAWIDQLALPANVAPSGTFPLTLSKAGTGAGTVTSSPAGINCGSTCAANFASGTVVTLTAAAAAGSTFAAWSGGGCSGTGGCTVTVTAATPVTATFTAKVASTTILASSVNPSTPGQSVTFTAAVSGSSGTATGTVTFKSGTTSICTAVALVSGQAQCATAGLSAATHSMTAEYSGNAAYLASTSSVLSQVVNPSSFTLTVTRAGAGTGTVTSSPAGISCGSTCAASFGSGTAVTLTAAAAAGSTFAAWSGGGCSGTGGCTVTVTAATTVTATFTAKVASTTTLASSLNPSTTGQSVTFTAAVSGSSGTATGTVTFKSGTTSICTAVALVSGQAQCATAGLSGSTHSMTSEYSGDAAYLASTSSVLSQVVNTSSLILTVTRAGAGTGMVFSSPAGINCGSTCAASFAFGSSVTLSAAATGGTFARWSGACSGTGSCQVTMNAAKTVTATFDPPFTSASAELALAQAAAPNPGSAGKDVMFTLTVTNNGPATATGVTLTNPLPAGSSYIWASPSCTVAGGTVTCTRTSLASGASAAFRVVVRPAAAGSLTNSPSVAAIQSDPISANNSASSVVTVSANPVAAQVLRYRLYSDVTKEHHFTTDLNEYTVLGNTGGVWIQEGTVGKVLNNPGSFNGVTAVPYYRLYDNNTRWHHWTTDPNEYYTLGFVFSGWNMEGVDGYIFTTQPAGTVELFRLNYPALGALHHWTIDPVEYGELIARFGWIGEPGAGFVIQ